MNKLLIFAMSICVTSPLAMADTLRVTVTGIKAGEGNLRLGVFNESRRDQWPEGMHLYGVDIPAVAGEMTVEIPFVEPGEYAISASQDLNQNQKLDRNAFRIPKEPYGFSGAWRFGSASYDKASFNTAKDGYQLTIDM